MTRVERELLDTLGLASRDVGERVAGPDAFRTGRKRESPKPLERVTGVPTQAQQPAAPGGGGPGAVAELERAAVAGEPPPADDEGDSQEQHEQEHDGC